MKIKKNFSIKDFNTFSVDVKAKYFVEISDIDELKKILKDFSNEKKIFLGEGTNTLFVKDWDGIVVKINFLGKEIVNENENNIFVKVNAGENWSDFVDWAVEKNYAGIEGMVMIPGTLGGAVTQSIGAYGQEVKDVLSSIEVLDIEKHKIFKLKPEECDFSYRYSNFKGDWKNKYIVIASTVRLDKGPSLYSLAYSKKYGRYKSVYEDLEKMVGDKYTIQDFAQAIKRQREKKLPDLEEFGSCGSFFKNPVVDFKKYEELEQKIPDLQPYPLDNLGEKWFKIPAGKLLDELGWKGYWNDNVGVFEKHALCIVTNKNASGTEIVDLANRMKKSVEKNYGVELVEEVDVLPKHFST